MPSSPKRICTYPGCSTLVLSGRCNKHPYERRKQKRPSSWKQGYDARWQKVRKRYLRANPYCEIRMKCKGDAARHVDHIVPLRDGGTHEETNLQSACLRCHSAKTARFERTRNEFGHFQ